MTGFSRRGAIAGFALGLAGLGLPGGGLAARGLSVGVPRGTMRLARRIERGLSGGEMLSVTREWDVSFVKTARGIEIAGQEVAASVSAPPSLAELARIEEQRPTDGMFPIILDVEGRIVGAGSEDGSAAVARAIEIAEGIIARSSGTEATKSGALRQLAAIQAAGSSILDRLPADLFYPAGKQQREIRKLELPGGAMGELELVYSAIAAPGYDWLETSERKVVTRLGGSERHSLEAWTLSKSSAG